MSTEADDDEPQGDPDPVLAPLYEAFNALDERRQRRFAKWASLMIDEPDDDPVSPD